MSRLDKFTGAVLFITLLGAGGGNADTLSGRALVEHLQHGGYVLLMRHASSPMAPPDRNAADPENRKLERQLDGKGRDTAAAMGRAMAALHIPIGTVLSSPTYRALETVRLAGFSKPQIFAQLGDAGRSMQKDAVLGQAGWLREKVSEPPARGANTVIVTHMPNIAAAFPDAAGGLQDGETLVFQPGGAGKAELVAKIPIEQWPSLSR
jgi:phosphohistidine phosphatase SixA